jgi:hypothetical protein
VIELTFAGIDLLPEQIADMQLAARDATIAAARAFGIGGSVWAVDRPSGGGVDVRSMQRQSDPIAALAFRQKPSALAQAIAGVPIGDEVWRVIVLSGDVQPGDVLLSAGSPPLAMRVDSVEAWYDYRRSNVSEVRHDD